MRAAKRIGQSSLSGVGREPSVFHRGRVAIHVRRSLTDEEMTGLSCEWLAIPARDEFSESGEVDMVL